MRSDASTAITGVVERGYQKFFLKLADGTRWRIDGDRRLLTRLENQRVFIEGQCRGGIVMVDRLAAITDA